MFYYLKDGKENTNFIESLKFYSRVKKKKLKINVVHDKKKLTTKASYKRFHDVI